MGKLTGKLLQGPRNPTRRAYGALARDARPYHAGFRPPGSVYAKAVGSFVPKLTQKAFEKYGFSAATLLTDWAQIVGADVAGYTAPERLKWPRGAGANAEVEDGAEGRPGATLMLRVDPARALDVEYKGRQIVERINAYFGYRAVAALRLIQAPVEATAPREAARPSAVRAPGAEAAATDDADPLARALARLEAGVRGQSAGPQPA
jgi:hypothetical protein